MAKPIEITLIANTRSFIAGTKDAGNALDDVSDSLDDMARDAAKAGKAGEQNLDRIGDEARDSSREVEKLEASFRELATASARSGQESARAFELSEGEKRRAVRESLGEIKNEAKQNAAETFSSFDGSASSLVSGVQGTLGGIVSSLGPLGAAAGAAGALGIGLVSGALQKADEDTAAFRQKVSQLATELIKTGTLGKVSIGYVAEQLEAMATETDDNGKSLRKLLENYKTAGAAGISSFKDVATAIVGASGNYDSLLDKQQKHLDDLIAIQATTQRGAGSDGLAAVAIRQKVDAQQALVDGLRSGKDAADQAREAQDAYAKAGGPELAQTNKLLEQQKSDLDEAATGWDDYWDSASNTFDVAGYLKQQADEAGKAAFLDTFIATAPLSSEAKAFLQQQGTDGGYAFAKGYQGATADQQAQLNATWGAAGKRDGDKYIAGFKAGVPSQLNGPEVAAYYKTLDTASLLKAAQNYVDRNPIRITGTLAGRFGVGQL